ncbi:GNAT family N-acetyltransferase [Brachybacterium endophyticum]|uniref:GNAT family N-acetyltransferase n=1 Tax=Brachybacterium endophyticum TaxID=2182385 RepID=UPI001F0CCDA7|nr:GNAT family N-acetyltransferase [Brachybacterium endophyticum]
MDPTITLREATPSDLPPLEEIEAAGDALFVELFGPDPFGPEPREAGEDRATQPGVVIVAVETGTVDGGRSGERVVGFAHVLEAGAEDGEGRGAEGEAHLEQLAVLPSHARRGIGSRLVEACCAWARRRGHRRITLRTYADVPWNAPFYERCGFREVPPIDTPFHRRLVEAEQAVGLDRHGRRVVMARGLDGDTGRQDDGV